MELRDTQPAKTYSENKLAVRRTIFLPHTQGCDGAPVVFSPLIHKEAGHAVDDTFHRLGRSAPDSDRMENIYQHYS